MVDAGDGGGGLVQVNTGLGEGGLGTWLRLGEGWRMPLLCGSPRIH